MEILGGDDGPQLPEDGRPRLIRRSFPHGARWFSVPELVALLDAESVPAAITVRDWFTMADSQVSRRLVGLPPASVECYEANAKWYGDAPARTGPPPGAWTAGQC